MARRVGQANEIELLVEGAHDSVGEGIYGFQEQASVVKEESAGVAQRVSNGHFAGGIVGKGDRFSVSFAVSAVEASVRVVSEVAPGCSRNSLIVSARAGWGQNRRHRTPSARRRKGR